MSARLELYVRRADGSAYCEAEGRETPEDRRRLDREARFWIAKANVVSVELKIETGRTGGYRRERRNG